ncbi:H-NS histone family protein [uncultured Ruegeria sp.]|uniref:H-NS histone family protein n=1 Tax=uncultured Ruegeria sp. TaxID=259304 RepID=UPI002628E655|nr:H-NS histone family protein [uncultured Ruegeria sp.]
MSINLRKLSVADLKALVVEIEERIAEAEKEAKLTALRDMRAVAEKMGVAFEDVISLHNGKRRKSGVKSTAKFANPMDPTQTWTGRGRKPSWVIAALDSGKSIEDLAI